MSAFYNEIDPLAAATLREAMARGLIAPGVVDERDIRDIMPDELPGFAQVHLFAGGGIWSYALRRAGWPDDRPIWTASCPCQPFSAAGKGAGLDDERHLWPAAYWLIAQCRPELVAGEQVADKGADPWLDLVQADVEALDYAFGCVPLASAGFGAPNMRHRSFWVAYAEGLGHERSGSARGGRLGFEDCGPAIRLADTVGSGRSRLGWQGQKRVAERLRIGRLGHANGVPCKRDAGSLDRAETSVDGARLDVYGAERDGPAIAGAVIGLADADGSRLAFRSGQAVGCGAIWNEGAPAAARGIRGGLAERPTAPGPGNPGPTSGFWADADWLLCRDPRGPRWRPVDAGTFPLAPGHPARVGGLRISGNAINAEAATAFIEAVIDVLAAPQARAA